MLFRSSGRQIRRLIALLCLIILTAGIFAARSSNVYAEAADAASGEPAAAETAEPAEPVRDPITNHLTNWPQMSEIHEDSAVLMDADTGAILYSLDRDVQRIPASITKIMTCLLVIENAKMDDIVTMTETGMKEAYGGSSNITPVAGEQFTVEQCLYMLMLKSANDIAAQLAEHVGGSVEKFVQMMNDRCQKIGTSGTHFNNPNGLPGDDHYTTAMDMALIMQECIKNETFRKVIATPVYTVPPTNMTATERTYENHCKLIIESDTEHYYPDCIGGKTGYTDLAWRTLVTAACRDGRTLICVTMHGSDNSDFTDHKNLYDYGFGSFTNVNPEQADGGEWELAGGATVPTGFDPASLKRDEKNMSDGSVRIDYSFEENPMGSVLKTKKTVTEAAEPDEERSDVSAKSAETLTGRQEADPESFAVSDRRDGLFVGLIIALVVLVILLGVVGYMLVSVRKKRAAAEEALRRRRAAERRRAAADMAPSAGRRSSEAARRKRRAGENTRYRVDSGKKRPDKNRKG